MRIRVIALVCIAFFGMISTVTEGASGHDLWLYYVLPVAAHTRGLHQTFWRTDVSIVNVYDWRSIRVYMKFLKTNQDNSGAQEYSYFLAAGASMLLEDVVSYVFGATGNGAIEFYTKDRAYFIVSARTYTGEAETYGLTQLGQEYFGHSGGMTIVSGVRETARFRASVGAVNVSDRPISLTALVYDTNGNSKGIRIFHLDPNSHTQVFLKDFAGQFDSGYVVWKCLTSGTGISWTGYATVTDNETGDGVFLPDRRNDQYVEYEPYYDLTGWWEGSTAGPTGDGQTWVYIRQRGSVVEGWDCDLSFWPGAEEAYFEGYMDGDEIFLTDGHGKVPYCWNDEIYDGHAIVTANSIAGYFSIRGDCFSGTQTFALTPSKKKSMPPPPGAR